VSSTTANAAIKTFAVHIDGKRLFIGTAMTFNDFVRLRDRDLWREDAYGVLSG
jgi:hypothetical protein